MIWLTWRQLRVQTALVYAGLLILAVALLATRSDVLDAYHAGVDDFLAILEASRTDSTVYQAGSLVVWAVPAVIGAFWGAPVVARELEAGTHRLVWSQSVTRTRWLATKLGIGVAAAMAATALVSLTLTWWCSPIDKAVNAGEESAMFGVPRIVPEIFGARGIAPIGYAAFAFALGVAAGAMIRRTVPAMAVMLVTYIAVLIALPFTIRPHLVEPLEKDVVISADNLHGIMGRPPTAPGGPPRLDQLDVESSLPGGWTLSSTTVDASGGTAKIPAWISDCLPGPGQEQTTGISAVDACFDRLKDEGYRQRVVVQPASHYWALQWRETGLLLAGAGALVGACFWRVRRLS